ncbi:MAG TPA: NAD(P)/FAD-dependent oxidoreductase [Stellaceae bacterium]|nr:NAD(P)/FAD-dependent oxidoreductase [Stellaceae bacterium]
MSGLRAMLPEQSDVLVIGGGPAGSCAATVLARRGYDVALVDKAHHPRETVGESVLPAAWKYFDMLGVADEVGRRFVKKAGGVVAWGDEITQIAFRDFAYDRPGLHVERAELDELLLRNAAAAGVRVCEGVRAASLVGGGAAVAGAMAGAVLVADGETRRHRCRHVIDATGQASLAARQFGGRRLDADFRFVALWGYFADSRYVSAGGVVRPFAELAAHPPMTFVTRLGGWGWSWHIPMRRVTSVGIVVPVADYRRDASGHASLEEYFLATCRAAPGLARLIAEARLVDGGVRVLRDFSYLAETVAGPGFLVIGDAAGFVDPIFSIGVVMALYSGQLAAWTIERALRNPAAAEAARRLFAHQMRGRYELARTMALPGRGDGKAAAAAYFDFFSRSEKELMWSAASMTTRSANLVRASAGAGAPPLKRRRLAELHFG